MKIAYYCQHVLGVGHFHRSLEICRTCAENHEVAMIVGGPPISCTEQGITIQQLPGLRMDSQFGSLTPCERGEDLDQVKRDRREQLLSFARSYQPDILILELYPFGRKSFRFELDPLLDLIKTENSSCRIYCSLRDILVEKSEGLDKFETRAVTTLNRYFDGLFVHGDRNLVSLDQTFGKIDQLTVPIHYTGYVTPRPSRDARASIRQSSGMTDKQKLVVASIGSGSVGGDLLESAVHAATLLADADSWHLQVFTGPYCNDKLVDRLRRKENRTIKVERFSDRFIDWLGAADLSVSMAGYNTCMNTLAANVPALMLPFDQNREQRIRVEKLMGISGIRLLQREDLQPSRLADLMARTVKQQRVVPDIDLDGAARTRQLIEILH